MLLNGPVLAADTKHGLRVPDGFEVTEFADEKLANDISTMTLDPRGRVVVSSRGYIRTLIDDDGDRRADRAEEFANAPRDGAMGLFWEGDTLYFTGDGGLRRFRDRDGDGKADGPSELIRALKTGGEHAAHGIRRGPDGWLYVLCGNNTGIDGKYATLATSPIKEPVAGCVLRFSPELKDCEIVADGFRNAYDMDFNPDGELFTYDSDNERCVALPWYEGTRFYHVIPGGNHGWRSPQKGEFWRLPPYLPDVVAPVADLGRGSPTGCVCYRHARFPEKYRGGFFLLDWTFGKVHFLPLARKGSTYTSKPEVFIEARGDNGFAPTAAAVHPETGDLFVSIGGRGTRGAVYRISYPKNPKPTVDEVARLQPKPRRLDPPPNPAAKTLAASAAGDGSVPRNFALPPGREPSATLVQLRRLQLALGDFTRSGTSGTLWEGYTARRSPKDRAAWAEVARTLTALFPTGVHAVDRELSRTLAMMEDEQEPTRVKIAAMLRPTTDPLLDIHHLAVLARLPGSRSGDMTACVADALVSLDAKLTQLKLNRDRNWPLRIAELHAELAKKDPNLNNALLKHPDFGRPDHALFARCPGFDRKGAADRFLTRSREAGFVWNADLVKLVAELPAEKSLQVLRKLWGEAGLDEAILPVLAGRPQPDDREKFLDGLHSPQNATIRLCLDALEKLPDAKDGASLLALVRCLRRLADGKDEVALRERLAAYLKRLTGAEIAANDREAWSAWFAKTHPDLAAKLGGADGVDVAGWTKRLATVDWDGGDAGRGQAVFVKTSCATCHSGSQALGPDLQGAAGRFSRQDLFTAILQPSKDVSARYRTTQIGTEDGKVYQGLVIYEATDGLILQTAQATVRVGGKQIAERRTTDVSLMPVGLLDRLTDREIADLYAYLRSLSKPARRRRSLLRRKIARLQDCKIRG